MSLADRLAEEPARRRNDGCVTCRWIDSLTPADREAMHDWFRKGRSRRQFWQVASTDPDNPLLISDSAFKNHMQHYSPPEEADGT